MQGGERERKRERAKPRSRRGEKEKRDTIANDENSEESRVKNGKKGKGKGKGKMKRREGQWLERSGEGVMLYAGILGIWTWGLTENTYLLLILNTYYLVRSLFSFLSIVLSSNCFSFSFQDGFAIYCYTILTTDTVL